MSEKISAGPVPANDDRSSSMKKEAGSEISAEAEAEAALSTLSISDDGESGSETCATGTRLANTATGGHETFEGDVDLFGPPPSRVLCPICLVALPIDPAKISTYICCSARVCKSCEKSHIASVTKENDARLANAREEQARHGGELRVPDLLQLGCPFCRTSGEEMLKGGCGYLMRKRAAANDPGGLCMLGLSHLKGNYGSSKDKKKALEYLLRAADLGSTTACFCVGSMFFRDHGGKEARLTEARHYLAIAATKEGVHMIDARDELGRLELRQGNIHLALKHWKISGSMGHQYSLDQLRIGVRNGNLSKSDYLEALRASQVAKEEEWSLERDWFNKNSVPNDCFYELG